MSIENPDTVELNLDDNRLSSTKLKGILKSCCRYLEF